MKQIYLLTLLVMASLLTTASMAGEIVTVKYQLTPQKLMSTRILIETSPNYPKYAVIAELNFEEMRVFRKLTKENIGKRLEVFFEGRVLMGAIVKGEIDNGKIGLFDTNDKEEALSLVRDLLP